MNTRRLANIFHLGIKELRSLRRDPLMLFFIVFAFSVAIYSAASVSTDLHKAPIAVVDEDRSQLSGEIVNAFLAPYFKTPELIGMSEADERDLFPDAIGLCRDGLTFIKKNTA